MKNVIIAILAIILLIGVSGCASNESAPSPPTGGAAAVQETQHTNLQKAFAKIQESQTKDQIINLLGEPMEKQKIKANLEYWYYESGTDVLQLAFDPNTVSAKRLY